MRKKFLQILRTSRISDCNSRTREVEKKIIRKDTIQKRSDIIKSLLQRVVSVRHDCPDKIMPPK